MTYGSGDVCDHFGFRIWSFRVVTPSDDSGFECVADHGLCIEISLDYPSGQDPPLPLEADIAPRVSDTEFLEPAHNLFTTTD